MSIIYFTSILSIDEVTRLHNSISITIIIAISILLMGCDQLDDADSNEPELVLQYIDGKLLNGDFSYQLQGWRAKTGAKWDRNVGHAKLGSVHVMVPSQMREIESMVQCVNIGKGIRFDIGSSIKSDAGTIPKYGARLVWGWYEGDGCTGQGEYGGYLEAVHQKDWQKLTIEDIQPMLGAKSAIIKLKHRNSAKQDFSVYWDDIYFIARGFSQEKATTQSTPDTRKIISPRKFVTESKTTPVTSRSELNLVANSEFNQDLLGWRSDWKPEWVGNEGYKALGAAKITAASTGSDIGMSALTQCIRLTENQLYNFGASFKRDPASSQKGGARLRISWYEHDNCSGRSKTGSQVDPLKKDGWQTIGFENVTPPKGVAGVLIHAIQAVDGKGEFIAYWDDFYFIPKQ